MEVLVREPGPQAEFSHLTAGMPVELEPGNVFRSYEALNLQVPSIEGQIVEGGLEIPAQYLGLLLAALLGGIGVWGYRRGAGEALEPVGHVPGRSREEILLAIARMDEDFESQANPSQSEEARYRKQRDALMDQLKSLG
jgi:hypothetical protein